MADFRITVTHCGRYQFRATGFRNKEHAQEVYALLVERFPPDEDFIVSVWEWTPRGHPVEWAPCDSSEALGMHPPAHLRAIGAVSTPVSEQRERRQLEREALEKKFTTNTEETT